MNTIARTLSTISTAAILAFGMTPAMAVESHTTRLVERADGTLAIEQGRFFGGKSSGKILAEAREEVATYVTPVEETGSEKLDLAYNSASSKMTSIDPNRRSQWGLDKLEIEDVWAHTKGAGITVAVIDTGVDATHPDFEGRAIRGYTAPGQKEGDFNGHGTHVAGIIGAGDNNNIAGSGVAPDIKIFEAKVTQDNGVGNSSWMASGIVAAINAGVDVINISMTANAPMPLVEAAINQAVARNIPVFAAAGNDAAKGSPARWPAAYPNAIAVGSVSRTDALSTFSNTNDYVELTAPGSAITSTLPSGTVGMMSGTSQATPHVAGAAAILKSLKSDMSISDIRTTLVKSTTGPYKTLCIHDALEAIGYKRTFGNTMQAPKPVKPISTPAAPKPANPVRHFVRPER